MFSDGVRQTFVNDGLICLRPCNYARMCVCDDFYDKLARLNNDGLLLII